MFRCNQDVFRQDFVTENTGEGYQEFNTPWKRYNSEAFECRFTPAGGQDLPLAFEMYSRLVESYMTYSTDILPAFQGMSQVFHALCRWKTLNGLIENVIDFSLLRRPNGSIERTFKSNGDSDQE